MIIGVLKVVLAIEWSASLKDKRSVIRSVKARLHREHMVSVAEVGTQENWQKATLGIVLASSDMKACQSTMTAIVTKLQNGRDFTLDDQDLQITRH